MSNSDISFVAHRSNACMWKVRSYRPCEYEAHSYGRMFLGEEEGRKRRRKARQKIKIRDMEIKKRRRRRRKNVGH